jgi:hypothetical protein
MRFLCLALVLSALAAPAVRSAELALDALFAGLTMHEDIVGKTGVELLKGIEEYCRTVFLTDDSFAEGRSRGSLPHAPLVPHAPHLLA